MSAGFEQNCKQAGALLARFARAPLPHFIAGQHTAGHGGAQLENFAPADGRRLGSIAAGSEQDVDAACRAAHESFAAWRDFPAAQRRAVLHRIADLIVSRREEIALVESSDTGQPIRFMSQAALRGAENFRFFADRAPGARDGQALPTAQHLNYTTRQPIGPIGVITPWNTPFMLSTWKIAPALAAGCSVVHKPAEWSPYSALLLAEIAQEAGLPDGVLNIVNGAGEVAGRALTMHPLVRAVAFVGESATGSAIQAQTADNLTRLHFELGGKNPVIVFDDADLERALDAVVFMIYSLNGERCTSSSRLLVHEKIHDEFVAKVAARVSQLRVGHPLDPATELGPLIHPRHLEKVRGYLQHARAAQLTLHTGDAALREVQARYKGGYYAPPALIAGARDDDRVAQEEIFGPVLTALPFQGETEARRLANDTPYGLAAYLWTRDLARAHRLAATLDAGMVWVNSENRRHLPAPFGGMKRSGIGRDGGDWSFDFYMETKNICVALGEHAITKLGASAGADEGGSAR